MSELTLDFSGVAYAKMMAMVASTSTEVAWQGIVEKKNDDLYHISDIVIHPQYVSAARVTDADEEYSQWITEIWRTGDLFERLKLQGHSHVNFAALPSAIDIQNNLDALEMMDGEGLKIFVIWNKRNAFSIIVVDYECETDVRPCRRYTVDGIDVEGFVRESQIKLLPTAAGIKVITHARLRLMCCGIILISTAIVFSRWKRVAKSIRGKLMIPN